MMAVDLQKKKLEQVEKKKSTQMTRTESSRSDQKVLCATAPWERDGEGKERGEIYTFKPPSLSLCLIYLRHSFLLKVMIDVVA
jgi:hypothetical protein